MNYFIDAISLPDNANNNRLIQQALSTRSAAIETQIIEEAEQTEESEEAEYTEENSPSPPITRSHQNH